MSSAAKRRIRYALWAYAAVAGGVGFFALSTYLIVTPGGSGTMFQAYDGPTDPAQALAAQLWFIWGLIGGAFAGIFATFPPLQEDS